MMKLLVVAVTVDAAGGNASAGCACLSWPWAGAAAFIASPVTTLTVTLVNATGDGTDTLQYPTAYGMDGCQAHDQDRSPYCADSSGVALAGAPGWCASPWCFVDKASCDTTTDPSSYFHGSDPALTYSYETCAAVNTFADTIHDPAACDGTHSTVTAAHCNAPEAPRRRRVQGFTQHGGRCLPESARVSNQVQADLLPFFQASHDESTPLTVAYGNWESSHILARALKIQHDEPIPPIP